MGERKQQFTGWWIPADIVNLFLDGKLNSKEMILLANIDGMVDRSGEGCHASNKTLGKPLRVSDETVRRMLQKLKKMDLVIETGFDGRRRFLETAWSRSCPHKTVGSDPTKMTRLNPLLRKGSNKTREDDSSSSGDGGFLKLHNPKNKSKPSLFDKACARQLREAVKKFTRTLPSSKLSTDAQSFRLLREQNGISQERLENVLDWFCDHIKNQFVPRAHSGKTFREKFIKIEDAIERMGETPVEVSERAEKIVKRLQEWKWPKGSASQLPTVVQQSVEFEDLFHKRLVKLLNAEPDKSTNSSQGRRRNMFNHILESFHPDFVFQWFTTVYKQVQNWEAWNGNLTPHRLHHNAEKFRQYGRQLLISRGIPERQWDKLMEEVDACV